MPFRKISALNQEEEARENYRLLDYMLSKERRQGKESGDLLDPAEVSPKDNKGETTLVSPQPPTPHIVLPYLLAF